MKTSTRKELLRLRLGELSTQEAAGLRRRLEADAALAAAYEALCREWDSLADPPLPEAPAGFSRRVLERIEAESGASVSLLGGPWARVAALVVLLLGMALGSRLAVWMEGGDLDLYAQQTLADEYWSAFEGAAGGDAWAGDQP